MTSIAAIPVSSIRKLDVDLSSAVRQLSPVEVAQMQDMREQMLMPEYSHVEGPPDTLYATVRVGNETVKLYNSGSMESSNALGSRLQNIPGILDTNGGPAGAQARAEMIASALGGKITKSHTAMTQAEWQNAPKQHLVTDWDALRRDPRLASYYRTDPNTALQAHLLAS